MKKVIILFLLLSSFVVGQERTYIEFIPMAMWGEKTKYEKASKTSFDWYLGVHVMIGNNFAVKPFFETFHIEQTTLWFVDEPRQYNRVGTSIRYYFGGT